jgi:hypothetical protein
MITTEQISQQPVKPGRALAISGRGKLAYVAMLAGGLVLAATGIGTLALGKPPMSNWVLMAHVSAAPLFAIGLAFVAVTWADRCRFGSSVSRQSGPAKALLWLILACGLVVILSAVIPMTPLFGTSGEHTLYLTHRYSAVILTAAVALHLLLLFRGRNATDAGH